MKVNKFVIFTLTILSLTLGFLSFKVLRPFLVPIAWAVVLSIVFYPLYAFVLRYVKWKSLASLITLVLILMIIIGPFSYVSFLLAVELKDVARTIEEGKLETLKGLVEHPNVLWAVERLKAVLGLEGHDMGELLSKNLATLGKNLMGKVTEGAKNIVAVFLNFVFMAFSIFFLLRDGPDFIKKLNNYLPFSEEQKHMLEDRIKGIVVSTVFGGVVVALVQGTIGGVAFFFLGIPSPVIWGVAIFVMSFIPLLGTFSIWGPAVVYLYISGEVGRAFALALIGTFGISMVDNILKPLIISGRTKMPTLIIFFSILGGLKLFGLIGLIAGPLVLALFVSVIELFGKMEGGSDA